MSVKLYTGIPGSGKTYRIVYELKYKDLLDKYYVFHNIEELKMESPFLREYGPNCELKPKDIFNYKAQTELAHQVKEKYNRNILFIIDECDKYGFDRVDSNIKEWISMHRHLGQDIYLMTQSKWNIAKDYYNLCEVEINGQRGHLFNAFIYAWFVKGEKISTDRLPKKKDVYELYRSFHHPELNKKRSKLIPLGIGFFVCAILMAIYFFTFKLPDMFKGDKEIKKVVENKIDQKIEPVQKKISIFEAPETKDKIYSDKIFYYGGRVKDNYYLIDKNGNRINIKKLIKNPKVFYDDENSLTLYDHEKIYEYRSEDLASLAWTVGGRDRPGAQEQTQVRKREYKIQIK